MNHSSRSMERSAPRLRLGYGQSEVAVLALLLVSLFLGGCAVGYGEEATGVVEVSVVPGGTVSGGVRFDQATLRLLSLDLMPGEEEEAGGGHSHDHGHDHGHSHLEVEEASAGLAAGDRSRRSWSEDEGVAAGDEPDLLRFGVEATFPTEVDLLGTEQRLGTIELAATHYEGLTAQVAGHTGCGLFASGVGRIDGEDVPVEVCLPALDLELAIHLDLGLDERVPLRLLFSVNGLLEGVDVSRLAREEDGSIRIDDHSNPFTAMQVEKNLQAAFSTL